MKKETASKHFEAAVFQSVMQASNDTSETLDCIGEAVNLTESDILKMIGNLVAAELPQLPSFERAWTEAHLAAPPRLAVFSRNEDGSDPVSLWLVTDHTGNQDAGRRVVLDPETQMFGLVEDWHGGIEWFVGFYEGGFADVVMAM